jgi:hypothetical protein
MPLIAGIRTPRQGRPPKSWTTIDRDYDTLRRTMQTLLNDLGITTKATAGSTTIGRGKPPGRDTPSRGGGIGCRWWFALRGAWRSRHRRQP